MNIEGSKIVPAPRSEVWAAFNDPAFLQRVLPGCREIQVASPEELDVRLSVSVGPVTANFKSRLEKFDVREGQSYALRGEGNAGPAGAAHGVLRVELQDVDGGTRVAYSSDVQITGKLGQLGSRLVESVARRYSEDFFRRAVAELSAEPQRADVVPVLAAPVPAMAGAPSAALAGLGWKLAIACALGSFVGTFLAHWIR